MIGERSLLPGAENQIEIIILNSKEKITFLKNLVLINFLTHKDKIIEIKK
tara:strand:- start:6894 stop:7043 length:150 start_codon:yes stop_codon:yes gene_type:complete